MPLRISTKTETHKGTPRFASVRLTAKRTTCAKMPHLLPRAGPRITQTSRRRRLRSTLTFGTPTTKIRKGDAKNTSRIAGVTAFPSTTFREPSSHASFILMILRKRRKTMTCLAESQQSRAARMMIKKEEAN